MRNFPYSTVFIVIIILFGIFSYTNSLHVPFIFDDINGILKNPLTTQLEVIPHLQVHRLRFLPYYSFAINFRIGGWDVFGYHLFNVTLHIANSLLIFFLLRLILKTRNLKVDGSVSHHIIPFTAAVLFLVHPIQTQAVTYVSQRLTLMAAFFYLSTMLLYLKATREKLRLMPYIGAFIAMGVTLICKEIAFTLPITLVSLSLFFPSGRPWKKQVVLLLPFFAIPLTAYLIAIEISNSNILALISLPSGTPSLSRTDYILTQLNVIRTYIRLLIFPVRQNLDYDYPISRSLLEPNMTASLLLLLSILTGALAISKTNRLAAFGVLFFFIALLVESTIIPITDVINEHRVYLPSVGFFILVSIGYAYIYSKLGTPNRRHIATFALFSIFALLIFATVRRNDIWSSEYKLWSDVVAKSPNKVRPRIALGLSLANQNQLSEAVRELQTAYALNQRTASRSQEAYDIAIHEQLASVYERLSDWESAGKHYEALLIYFPHDASLIETYALMYLRSGNSQKGQTLLQKALEENPRSATFHYNLGNLYFSEGNVVLAEQQFREALKLNPDFEEAKHNLQIITGNNTRQ
ncbi:hypothetical protein A3D05_04950 [Candidatus Gottesmanbacteria bacterium RIFCSPHIGHO2_02_FULL_40_24]|uniref:Uncharacterized protein n=1 Tax=Candidatus Gottesmanbacteria bacterium RIFCSPHIGHO2_01_FULL_40_15 TaxID=1798376 RepID=A0A1F5Z211_9BACT|nr:MAG: hypothetical protein A2777_05980 [Candidatus Gottesmanbacteria bacterium RIFCSPHIGHO2_01_FULL_40_15]OGG16219.1 MAG: hypothetical protein A3D05_04950 [Candidatus Gottesmanbacteria bacterium RIFCSPHIGHO2_02_FULL_40_24]OGG23212.1 MAG: hypothetical protein A3B48_00330 [Candidatus Gottesmanbacteria bacterium RIFCSPLOWO2_01_FULL_40_10]